MKVFRFYPNEANLVKNLTTKNSREVDWLRMKSRRSSSLRGMLCVTQKDGRRNKALASEESREDRGRNI